MRRGLPPGGNVPYGYRRNGKGLVLDRAEAEIVRRIFELVGRGQTAGDIARALNAKGLARRNSRPWTSRQVAATLSRKLLYVEGRVRYGETRGGNRKLILLNPDSQMSEPTTILRKADANDLGAIHALVEWGAGQGALVSHGGDELARRLEQFMVADAGGRVVGVVALRPVNDEVAELCSLAVLPDSQGRGMGRELVRACVEEARRQGRRAVIALTFRPDYFERLGFRLASAETLPDSLRDHYAPGQLAGNEVALRMELTGPR